MQREQWVLHQRVRERIRERLAPVIGRLLDGEDPERDAEELRPVIAGLRPAVAAGRCLARARRAPRGRRGDTRRGARGATGDAVRSRSRSGRRAGGFPGGGRWPASSWARSAPSTPWTCWWSGCRTSEPRCAERPPGPWASWAIQRPRARSRRCSWARAGVPIGVANDALSRLGPAGAEAFREGLLSPESTVRVTSCFGIAGDADPASEGRGARAAGATAAGRRGAARALGGRQRDAMAPG